MANRLRNFFHKHIQLANNAIWTLFLGLAFACALSCWFSAGDMTIIVPALIVGWLFACIAWWYAPGISRMGRNLWIAVSTVALVFEALFLYYHFHNQTTVNPAGLNKQLLYTCQPANLPTLWPEDGELKYLEVIGPPVTSDNLQMFAMYMGFIGGAQTESDSKTFAGSTMRCSISNLSSVSITSFKAKFSVQWLQIQKAGNGLTSGPAINTIFLETPEFQLGTSSNQAKYFFVVNESKTLIKFTLPDTATIKAVGSDDSAQVNLLHKEYDLKSYAVWPLAQYLKGLLSAPLPTPAPPQQPARK